MVSLGTGIGTTEVKRFMLNWFIDGKSVVMIVLIV